MEKYLDVSFAPVDRLNPKLGYQLAISDARTGEKMLLTASHPVTGQPLQTAIDCLDVAGMYASTP